MTSSNPAREEATEPSEHDESITGAVAALWIAIIVNATGVMLALLPPHWEIAGSIIAFIGTMILFAVLWRIDIYTKHDKGSKQRKRGTTAGSTAIIYSALVISASAAATITPSFSPWPGIALGIMALIPGALGVRLVLAVHERAPFRTLADHWGHGPASVAAVLFFAFYFVASNSFGMNSFLLPVLFIPGLFGAILFVPTVNARCLTGPKWATATAGLAPALLFFVGMASKQAGWLALFGSAPRNCALAGAEFTSSRTNTAPTYIFQCGSDIVEYNPLFSETVDIHGDHLVLVTDRLHLTQALQPHEVFGAAGVIYLTILAVGLIGLAVGIIFAGRTPRGTGA